MGGKRLRWPLVVISAAAIAAAGHASGIFERAPAGPTTVAVADAGQIGALLDQVQVVQAVEDHPGYDRSCKRGHQCVFGPAWNDPDSRTGCDTRQTMLRESLTDVVFKPGTRNCKVLSGTLPSDPYTGQTIHYTATQANALQVDHVIPLSRAWDAGAWAWDLKTRQRFANDHDNLLVVSGAANQSKSDGGLDEWLPINSAYRCTYVQRYLRVAVKYGLPITEGEKAAATTACLGTP
ncbi:HNH endonuclease family protein [Mycolicibacterium fortuitum]|uniref:HNH endonuclease family protein n=1 Tax=Mycolicibacterium fortuitum TaxID=1766 RepID=UPI00260D362E|nr:HNH endonuclease family protein [Mycolicibacterium fortuitum]